MPRTCFVRLASASFSEISLSSEAKNGFSLYGFVFKFVFLSKVLCAVMMMSMSEPPSCAVCMKISYCISDMERISVVKAVTRKIVAIPTLNEAVFFV